MRQALVDEIDRLIRKHKDSDPSNPADVQAWNREKIRIKMLTKIASVMAYESGLNCNVLSASKNEFERFMRSNQRVEKALSKFTTAAVKYNVSALKDFTLQIGDRLLTFPVWAEFDAIPFTAEDMELLRERKTPGIMALIDALTASKSPMLVVKEYPICEDILKFSGPKFFVKTSLAMVAAAAEYALWFDIDVMRPKYVNDRELGRSDCSSNIFEIPDTLFHVEPQPGDNLKISTLRVNFYNTFSQRVQGFAPVLDAVYPIFTLSPIPADIVK
jgi:hypothetical protein